MVSAAIYGAGSSGNHLAYACRQRSWNVTMIDIDQRALERTRELVYPGRYGLWDNKIYLTTDAGDQAFDAVFIATPPDSHVPVAIRALDRHNPQVLLIEKPLCPPGLEGLSDLRSVCRDRSTISLVGYNHNLAANTLEARQILSAGWVGKPQSIHVRWQEHWGGILMAHPWLSGPSDSYLGYSARGGGACAEHSHAISILQDVARTLGAGRVETVCALMDFNRADGTLYDQTTMIGLRTESGLTGSILQDVVTAPPIKMLRVQGTRGFLEWYVNYESDSDAIVYGGVDDQPIVKRFPKTRADDFLPEIDEIGLLLEEPTSDSPNSLDYGIESALVVAAAHCSAARGEPIRIDYNAGPELTSLQQAGS